MPNLKREGKPHNCKQIFQKLNQFNSKVTKKKRKNCTSMKCCRQKNDNDSDYNSNKPLFNAITFKTP